MTTTTVHNPPNITGAWFPSGFYGHYRSVARNDIYQQFRQLAKPQPPKAFLNRLKETPNKHIFSNHDNRFSYVTDATYLDMGVGKKRRLANSTFNSNPHLLAWAINKPASYDTTIYESTFSKSDGPGIIIPNIRYLKGSKPTAYDQKTTSYRYSFGNANPDRLPLRRMCDDALLTKSTTAEQIANQRRCKTSFELSELRGSVADCLIWHDYNHSQSATKPLQSEVEELN